MAINYFETRPYVYFTNISPTISISRKSFWHQNKYELADNSVLRNNPIMIDFDIASNHLKDVGIIKIPNNLFSTNQNLFYLLINNEKIQIKSYKRVRDYTEIPLDSSNGIQYNFKDIKNIQIYKIFRGRQYLKIHFGVEIKINNTITNSIQDLDLFKKNLKVSKLKNLSIKINGNNWSSYDANDYQQCNLVSRLALVEPKKFNWHAIAVQDSFFEWKNKSLLNNTNRLFSDLIRPTNFIKIDDKTFELNKREVKVGDNKDQSIYVWKAKSYYKYDKEIKNFAICLENEGNYGVFSNANKDVSEFEWNLDINENTRLKANAHLIFKKLFDKENGMFRISINIPSYELDKIINNNLNWTTQKIKKVVTS
ncbi:hypothetical protein [[Mycoplasma] anseris]|uniref:Uncharacterized protein n=1 Tax=[Mycoplasma] anseris TaxID=92400 RepID=A0A2Z4NCE6_9BACT|nr:hypothetical protein [[Mycoplasma] anseris]AWX69229.1 hypothetical protein DP065_00435 [[Mycoplasma] anseris]